MTIKERDELVEGLELILDRFHRHPYEMPREDIRA